MAKGIVIKDRDGDKDQHQPKGREKTEQETGKEREKTTSKALREHFSAHFEKLRAHREQADAAMLVEDDAGEGPKEEGHAAGRENPDTADSERQGIRQSPRTRQLLSASPPLLPPSADEGQPGQETTQLQEAGGDRSTSWDQAAALLLYQPPPGPEVKVEPVVDITVPGELYGSDSNGAPLTPTAGRRRPRPRQAGTARDGTRGDAGHDAARHAGEFSRTPARPGRLLLPAREQRPRRSGNAAAAQTSTGARHPASRATERPGHWPDNAGFATQPPTPPPEPPGNKEDRGGGRDGQGQHATAARQEGTSPSAG
eukprot:CAMPEP_0168492582 /NCGR_PEP_ID=MMETSP0228-20121227/70286_1 /TAXON_ID=133427 /ORGANISM="Protoceratium reticulatum, Strain CCCM 535 (=CCMP 1889)" /LENGTH=312 /DNA_ID=CAMNT_0008509355 /DNA_START=98 /DNA_END=1032 /DNA_ORIENTATION=+